VDGLLSLPRPRALTLLIVAAAAVMAGAMQVTSREWLPGDSHIHSHWSPGYDRKTSPPTPIRGGDARYSTPVNAAMAEKFGLKWMVTTDHGGPNHAKTNLEEAYPELLRSRSEVPGVVQFYGMELNLPGMDHHTLILPRMREEAQTLFEIESRFDANEAWPVDPERRTAAKRVEALRYIAALPSLPLMFANHPSRSAKGAGTYGADEPWELRQNNDTAPEVYRGMEGAPGHQAGPLAADGSTRLDENGMPRGSRGGYGGVDAGTMGGFDRMTAIVGGLWDSLLSEGRRFWIVATSDSHVHYTEAPRPGSDFWPGEFHKTYVLARQNHDDILDGLRAGRVFVVAGDLISLLEVEARAGAERAAVGGMLRATAGADVDVTIRFRVPAAPNHHGDRPQVARVDLIAGDVRGPGTDPQADRNPTTRVVERFDASRWTRRDDEFIIRTTLRAVGSNMYIRVRGTNTSALEPAMDPKGENPWTDLWFYSNPIFIDVK
jgi:hypothetical protein